MRCLDLNNKELDNELEICKMEKTKRQLKVNYVKG